ncbi:MAG: hypothetical protein SGI77_06705 [Pirellulaceae bacterium]|nr:hypothetical protein [Pirellulaceae bacterium]
MQYRVTSDRLTSCFCFSVAILLAPYATIAMEPKENVYGLKRASIVATAAGVWPQPLRAALKCRR